MRRSLGWAIGGVGLLLSGPAAGQGATPEPSPVTQAPPSSSEAGGTNATASQQVSADTGAGTGAAADEGSEPIGIDVGLRLGYAVPFGDIAEANAPPTPLPDGSVGEPLFSGNQRMRDSYDGHVPIQLDLGFRVTDNFVVGVYGLYGIGVPAGQSPFSCDDQLLADFVEDPSPAMAMGDEDVGSAPELDCSATVLRAGVQLRYHFEPDEQVDPWVGAGIGFESLTATSSDTDTTLSLSGIEFFNVNAGLEIQLAGQLRMGPYMQLAAGRYSSISGGDDTFVARLDCPGPDCLLEDDDISTATHFWATGGIRTSYVF